MKIQTICLILASILYTEQLEAAPAGKCKPAQGKNINYTNNNWCWYNLSESASSLPAPCAPGYYYLSKKNFSSAVCASCAIGFSWNKSEKKCKK